MMHYQLNRACKCVMIDGETPRYWLETGHYNDILMMGDSEFLTADDDE